MSDNQKLQKQLHRFRMVGIAEGVSFLVLLLIAMPLKYVFHIPEAVKFTGWVHGALFVTYIIFAMEVFGAFKKNFLWVIKAVIAAFVPLGTFIFDKSLKERGCTFTLNRSYYLKQYFKKTINQKSTRL